MKDNRKFNNMNSKDNLIINDESQIPSDQKNQDIYAQNIGADPLNGNVASQVTSYPNQYYNVFKGNQRREELQSLMGLNNNRVQSEVSDPVLGAFHKPKSLPPLSGKSSSGTRPSAVIQQQPQLHSKVQISNDIKIHKTSQHVPNQTHNNGPVPQQQHQFHLPPIIKNNESLQAKNPPIQKQKTLTSKQADSQVHPIQGGGRPGLNKISDMSRSNSVMDCLVDEDEVHQQEEQQQQNHMLQKGNQDQQQDEEGDISEQILDNTGLSKGQLTQRQRFFDEFYAAENYIVPSGSQPTYQQISRAQTIALDFEDNFKRSNNNLNNSQAAEQSDNSDIEIIEGDKCQHDIFTRKELLRANSRKLKVLSNTTYFVHDSILFNLEVKEGLEEDKYFGFDENIDENITDTKNESIYYRFKNKYSGLGPFQEYNIKEDDITSYNIESNIQVVLYHLPEFIKIKTINVPMKYLNMKCSLSVSSQSNMQIYQSNCVYFISLEGQFIEQNQNQLPMPMMKLGTQFKIPSIMPNISMRDPSKFAFQDGGDINENNEPDVDADGQYQFKLRKYVEKASYSIIVYKPPAGSSDGIINAVQFGTRGKDLQKILITRKFWIDTYHLPSCNEYISDHDENYLIEMRFAYICNSRTVMLKGVDSELYILSKDQDKIKVLQTQLGTVTSKSKKSEKQKKQQNQLQQQITTGGQKKALGPEHKMIEISDRTQVSFFIIKHSDRVAYQNNSYEAFQILNDGTTKQINFGTVKDVIFLRLIDNFEKAKDLSLTPTQTDSFLNLSYHCRTKKQIYSFDLNYQKFSTHQYYTKFPGKPKSILIVNTGQSSGCGLNGKYEKHLLCLNKLNSEGFVLDCYAMKRDDFRIQHCLTNMATRKGTKDHSVNKIYINYIAQRSLYGSNQIQAQQVQDIASTQDLNQNNNNNPAQSLSLTKRNSYKNNRNQSMLMGLAEENPDANKASIKHSKSQQLYLQNDVVEERHKHLHELEITPTNYIFDASVELLNHFRYQCQKGLVQGLYQQKVAYNYHYDKYETIEELNYHKVLKCNSEYIWQAFVKKNYLTFCKQKIEDLGKNVTSLNSFDYYTIKLQAGILIREVVMSTENSQLLIIYQQLDEEDKWKRSSLYINVRNVINPFPVQQIENIRSVIEFSNNNIYLLQRLNDDKTHLVHFKVEKDLLFEEYRVDITDLMRQGQYQQSFAYNHYKPQSYFHFVYKDAFFVIQLDYSYYMIFKKDEGLQYFASFELTDKNLHLTYDNNELYFINLPVNDLRSRKMKENLQFNEGFIETILRICVQKLHIVFDLATQDFQIQDSEYQELCNLNMSFSNQYNTALKHGQNQIIALTNDHDLVRYIGGLNGDQILLHYDVYNYSFLHQILQRNQKVLDSVSKRLGSMNMKGYPFMFIKNSQGESILDIAVRCQDFFKINIILDMLIRYQNETFLNEIVDEHINYMLHHKFNLKEYFLSSLPMSQIQNVNYPNYSKDNSKIIYGDFKDHYTLNYIMNNYQNLLGKQVQEQKNKGQIQVEYFFLNIPNTITNPQFIKNLCSITDLELYETMPIQTIIDYKWNNYAYDAAIKQFFLFMVFLISYTIDIYLLICQGDDRNLAMKIVTKIINLIYIIIMEWYEIKLLKKVGIKSYMEDTWNYGDQILAFLYVACVVVDLTQATSHGLMIMHSVEFFFVFIKLCSNLRVFKGFSFQMSMLKAVFYDIRYFILLYSFVIGMYGFIFSLLGLKYDDNGTYYEGISYFGHFISAFRASIGDTQVDNFYELDDQYVIFAWLVWISAILFLNIILLNFIIAVISESYGKVMQRMTAESYRIKCLLIKEHESKFKEKHFQNKKFFPRFMILRRPTLSHSNDQIDWQGFVKDLKQTINKSQIGQISQFKSQLDNLRIDLTDKLQTLQKDQHIKHEVLESNIRFQLLETVSNLTIQQVTLDQKMEQIMRALNDQKIVQQQIQARLEQGAVVPPADLVLSQNSSGGHGGLVGNSSSRAKQFRQGFSKGSRSFAEDLQIYNNLVQKQEEDHQATITEEDPDFECEKTE